MKVFGSKNWSRSGEHQRQSSRKIVET